MHHVYYSRKTTGWLAFFVVSLLTINFLWAQAPTNGLVAYYPFNSNANDESGGGRNGTVYGATLNTDRFGNTNRAYDFDGINNRISAQAAFHPTMSVAVWFKAPMPTHTNGRWPVLYGFGLTSIVLQSFGTQEPAYNGKNGMLTSLTAQQLGLSSRNIIEHLQIVCDDKWHHAVGVYDNTTRTHQLYVDGILRAQDTMPVDYPSFDSVDFGIGNTASSGYNHAGYFKGQLDDIRIYNRTLSPFEVQNLYQTEALPPVPQAPTNGLIAYYPFNGNANDGSGNNNNGTVYGATLASDRRGMANGAYRFTDGTKIIVPNSSSLQFSNEYTFSGWFNLRSFDGRNGNDGGLSTTAAVHTIFSKSCDRDWLFFMVLPSPDGLPRMNFAGGTWPSGLSAFQNLNLNTWIHVAHIHGNNQSQLYINGVLAAASGGRIDFTASNQQDLIIGGMNCWSYFFNGELDDIRFYNRAPEVKNTFIAENGPIKTIRTGSWLDPTTWSCGCVPSTSNPVEVKHVVNVPAAQTGYALSLKYGTGGRIDLGANAKVVLIQE